MEIRIMGVVYVCAHDTDENEYETNRVCVCVGRRALSWRSSRITSSSTVRARYRVVVVRMSRRSERREGEGA